jgi:oxygen-independent coproporphyrinogen-3 oxidase
LSAPFYKQNHFDTIFFGGGTPSVLTPGQIEEILNCLQKHFAINPDTEISMEANPEDFLEKNVGDYSSAGINRLSLGVQSFIDQELIFLTRQHSSKEAEHVIKDVRKYFDNINLDIIYSLPLQKVTDLDYSLSGAIELGVNHISAYTLTYEERTVLYKSLQRNLVKRNPDSLEAELYSFVSEKLISNGYDHYEVSNFARKNYQCRHNLKYWNYENYIGFGPSAHSFFNNTRWNNFRDIVKYNSSLEKNILPAEEKYEVSDTQRHLEYVMLSLRSRGINFEEYKRIFKEDFLLKFSDSANELLKNDFAYLNEEAFHLNEKGFAVADEIISKYF